MKKAAIIAAFFIEENREPRLTWLSARIRLSLLPFFGEAKKEGPPQAHRQRIWQRWQPRRRALP
jgi:hypothetical protein